MTETTTEGGAQHSDDGPVGDGLAAVGEAETGLVDDRITVVIPAKNEARSIADVIRASSAHADHILVLDGASQDDTVEVARSLGVEVMEGTGNGKGAAIRAAIPAIHTGITVFIDADGSHDPADIPALVAPLLDGSADHVSASRLIGGSSELHGGFDEFLRLSGSAFITYCINRRFGVRLSESQNGYRALRTEVLRNLDLRERVTTIEQEMIMKTLKKGYRMGEVPSHEYPRRFGESNISVFRLSPRYLYSLFKYLLV